MLLILIIIISGSILGFYIAKKKNGNFLDKLQYIAIFGIIFFLISIVIQILQTTLPYFQRLAMEGETGRAKITQITRYGTVVLATVQDMDIAIGLET